MDREGFRVTAEHEASHWWFRSRRELFLRQVACAAAELRSGSGAAELRSGGEMALLDYGCGTGFNLTELARFGRVVGADVVTELQRSHWKAHGHALLDLSGDVRAAHGTFDILTALDVLEHIEDDVAGLRAMAAFLRPRGQIVLTVPAYRWLWSDEDDISRHIRRYTESRLRRVARAAGLEVRFMSYFNLSILPAMAASVAFDRLRPRRVAPKSSLDKTPRALEGLLRRVTSFEGRLVGGERVRLPAGPSLVARLQGGG